jgi:hypothetical protein
MTIETLIGMGAGGALLLLGIIVGRFTNSARGGKTERPHVAICTCDHGYGMHNRETGKCNGSVEVQRYSAGGSRVGKELHRCACLHYDGPTPIEQYFASQTLPPKDA